MQSTATQASLCTAFSSQETPDMTISTLWLHVPVFDHLHGEKSFSLSQTGISLQLVLLSHGEASDTPCSSGPGWQHPLMRVLSGLSPLMCQVPSAHAGTWPLALWHYHCTVLSRISGPLCSHPAKCCYEQDLCAGYRLELGSSTACGAVRDFPCTAVSWRQELQQFLTRRQPAEALCESWQKQKLLEAKPHHQQWARSSQPMQLSDVLWSSLQGKVGKCCFFCYPPLPALSSPKPSWTNEVLVL